MPQETSSIFCYAVEVAGCSKMPPRFEVLCFFIPFNLNWTLFAEGRILSTVAIQCSLKLSSAVYIKCYSVDSQQINLIAGR